MFEIAKEHKGFGKQIFLLAKNELIKTYKGAVIGPFWAVVKPAFTLFVYWFAFTVGIKGAGEVHVANIGNTILDVTFERFTFMLVGFIPWFFITDSITQGAKSIRTNRQFVTKVKFPVSTIMTYTAVSRLYVQILLSVLMYIYLCFVSKIPPTIYNLQFFFYCPLMFAFFVVLTWSTAPMCAFSRDLENMIISIMSGIFWLSGVIYNSYDFKGILRYFMLLNPINFFANGYRKAFLYQQWFWQYPTELLVFVVEFVILIALGIFNYNRLHKTLPDVL